MTAVAVDLDAAIVEEALLPKKRANNREGGAALWTSVPTRGFCDTETTYAKTDEIESTPEMIEAGVIHLYSYHPEHDVRDEETVSRIFEAMYRELLAADPPDPQPNIRGQPADTRRAVIVEERTPQQARRRSPVSGHRRQPS